MKTFSTTGLVLAAAYLLVCTYLILTQGLFGESFIAILLGLPWSLAFSYVEYMNATGGFLYFLILAPLVFNAFVLYWVGALIGKLTSR